mgnify:CR=1 FL=1
MPGKKPQTLFVFIVFMRWGYHIFLMIFRDEENKKGRPFSRASVESKQKVLKSLDIVVQGEFPWMGTKVNGLHLALHLVRDPRFDHVRCEDISF